MDEKSEVYDIPAIRAKLLAKMGRHAGNYPTHIEQLFPRILTRIADLWGTAQLDTYLEALMLPDRQDRAGFPPDVAMEVFHLSTVHGALGFVPETTSNGWTGIEESALDKNKLVSGRK